MSTSRGTKTHLHPLILIPVISFVFIFLAKELLKLITYLMLA